jgi:hypothetical protein
MTVKSLSQLDEVCPRCGDFAVLMANTGWCEECSGPINATELNQFKLEHYLAHNADELEYYIAQGFSLNASVDKLHHSNGRPVCIVCGTTIKRAKRSSIFCRQTDMCRKYARRYIYLYQHKGLSKVEALAQIFSELT